MGIPESIAVDKWVLKGESFGQWNTSQISHYDVVTVLLMYEWMH